MQIPPYVLSGILALVLTYAIAYEMRGLSERVGAMTPPGGRHIHTQPMPRLGGLAIFGGALVALIVALPIVQPASLVRASNYLVLAVPVRTLPLSEVGILLGAVAITALGALDDLHPLAGRLKFPLIYLAAGAPVWFGMTTAFVTHPVTGLPVPVGMAGKVFTVIWLGSMAIAMNSIDGVDGLASGVAAITGITLLSAAGHRQDMVTMTLAATVTGSALGFLRHNFNPARLFLGDSGSMLLGFLLGAAAVQGMVKTATMLSLAVPVLALAIPILDTGYAIVRRYRNGVSIFRPDRGHLHHRLLDLGFSQRQVVVLLWLVSATLGLGGLAVAGISRTPSVVLLAAIAAVLVTLGWRLGLFRLPKAPSPELSDPARLR